MKRATLAIAKKYAAWRQKVRNAGGACVGCRLVRAVVGALRRR